MRRSCSKTKRFSAAPKNLPSRKSAGALWNISVSRKGKPATTAFKRKRRPLKAAESKSSALALEATLCAQAPSPERALFFYRKRCRPDRQVAVLNFFINQDCFFNTEIPHTKKAPSRMLLCYGRARAAKPEFKPAIKAELLS